MTALNILFYIVMVAIIYSIVMVYQHNQRMRETARLELIALIERSEAPDLSSEEHIENRGRFSLFYDIQFEEDAVDRLENTYANFTDHMDLDEEWTLNLIGEGKPRSYRDEAVKSLADYRHERDSMTA